jgi:hypothetical protein
MPGGDRTGPRGEGPMTGRAAGDCGYPGAGYPAADYPGPLPGRGFGFGRGGGWGRGWRNRFYATEWPHWGRWFAPAWRGFPAYGPPAPLTREREADALTAQAEWLQGQLDEINQRLADLEDQE